MKLSDYAKKVGVSYKTAHRWWKAGQLKGYQLPSGTIIIEEEKAIERDVRVCIYARVSSDRAKQDLDKQAEILTQYAIAKGYTIHKVLKEIASGVSDNRKLLMAALKDDGYNILLVERKDRLTRFGINYLQILLEKTGKILEIANEADRGSEEEIVQDLVNIINFFCDRIYGKRNYKKKAEKLIADFLGYDWDSEELN